LGFLALFGLSPLGLNFRTLGLFSFKGFCSLGLFSLLGLGPLGFLPLPGFLFMGLSLG